VPGTEGHRVATRAVLLLSALIALPVGAAPAETSGEQQARVQRIEDAVLAPCCYAEPVSRHQSEIAVRMRLEITKWVAAGKTDQEILDAYVQRYGAKVLVDPRMKPGPWTHSVPWLALAAGTAFTIWLLRRWRSGPMPAPSSSAETLPDLKDEDFLE
jgi:cytochrome c-type biogenesis protein CcmH